MARKRCIQVHSYRQGVRLIAINDGVDTARGDDDFTPFRNIMNEYYARDTSRKIRSTFQAKGKTGKSQPPAWSEYCLFGHAHDHFADCQTMQTEEHFKYGLSMGVLLMKEIYELSDFK